MADQKTGTILIVDDDQDILTAGKLLLKRHYAKVLTTNLPDAIPRLLAEQSVDAILLDMNFGPGASSGAEGMAWLKRILEIDPSAVVVMITAHGGVETAVDAIKEGATDFIAKPWQNEKVVATLSSAMKLRQSRDETETLKLSNKALAKAQASSQASASQPMLGQSRAMQDVKHLIDRAAPTDANVLILGENGTGKELAARALHAQSGRADRVFMSVDLGAVPETLFESELFGHKKGAFTDARTDRVGQILAANGGTLFLDEIGNLPLHLQAKLLTVLEQRRVTPVGSDRSIAFDVRVIAATNVPRDKLADESIFRQDLLFRLNTVEITMPPLRDRPEDIGTIANHYVGLYGRKYGKNLSILSDTTVKALQFGDWQGNVRALRHAIERAVILSDGAELQPKDFQVSQTPVPVAGSVNGTAPGNEGLDATAEPTDGDDLNLEKIEARAIQTALQRHRYNISRAAKDLGLTRAALYRRMEKHGL